MNEKAKTFDRISKCLLINKELNSDEKLLLAHIYSLQFKSKVCTASNEYFSKIFSLSKRTLTRRLTKLKSYGFIEIKIDRSEYDYSIRTITITQKTKDLFLF